MTQKITDGTIRKRIAENVRRLRTDRGLTLEAAAKLAEVHVRHWQRVEAGDLNITLRTLAKIGVALEVDPAALFAPIAPGST